MTQYPHNNTNNLYVSTNDDTNDEIINDESDIDDIIEDEQIMNDDVYETKIVDNKLYIGMPIYENTSGILFGCHISPESFYKYEIEKVCKFLKEMSCSESIIGNGHPEIIKLVQTNSENGYTIHTVLLKTVWLKIVQRRWKKIIQSRRQIIIGRGSFRNRKHNEITGMHLPEYSVLPRLQGCLSDMKQYIM